VHGALDAGRLDDQLVVDGDHLSDRELQPVSVYSVPALTTLPAPALSAATPSADSSMPVQPPAARLVTAATSRARV
jgi:hypothetical protein